MRTISRTARFKKDYKRESKGPYRATLDAELTKVLESLLADMALPARFRDHPLPGNGKIIATATFDQTCC